MRTIAACAVFLLAAPALAQEAPVPKMFQGMQGQKGQWQIDVLEGTGRAARLPQMTVCTENPMQRPGADGKAAKAEPGCKVRLLRDTADEAVMESTCPERTSTITLRRESEKSMLMSIDSKGPRGTQAMKMRYTHLGPCREGQGAISFDRDSEQCRRMRERADKLDPANSCRRAKDDDRERCEQRVREAAEKFRAMCG
jgi:hypothetical protein